MENISDENIAYSENNLQLLCISCHNKKTFKSPTFMKNGEIDFNNREEMLKNRKGKNKNK